MKAPTIAPTAAATKEPTTAPIGTAPIGTAPTSTAPTNQQHLRSEPLLLQLHRQMNQQPKHSD